MPPCTRCNSDLSPGWKFCVMCGAPRPAGDRTAGEALSGPGATVLAATVALVLAIFLGVGALAFALS